MIKPNITVFSNYVLIDNRRLDRPQIYSIGQWLEFWEKVQRLDELEYRSARIYL